MFETGVVIIPVWEYFPSIIIMKQIGKHVITQIFTSLAGLFIKIILLFSKYKSTS